MPAVVVQTVAQIVPNSNGPVAQVEYVVDVSVDQLDADKVLALSGVVQDDAFGLERLELEVDVGGRVGLQLGQSHVSVLRFEVDGMVDVLLSCPELGSDVGRRQLARPSHID